MVLWSVDLKLKKQVSRIIKKTLKGRKMKEGDIK